MAQLFSEWEAEVLRLLSNRKIYIEASDISSMGVQSFDLGETPISFVSRHEILLSKLALKNPSTQHSVTPSLMEDWEDRYKMIGLLLGWGIALGSVTIIGFLIAIYGVLSETQLRKEIANSGLVYREWILSRKGKQAWRIASPVLGMLIIIAVSILALLMVPTFNSGQVSSLGGE